MMFFVMLFSVFSFAQGQWILKGNVQISNGLYESLEGSEIVLKVTDANLTLCGRNLFSGNRVGKIEKKWERWGNFLYSGREKEGTFEQNRIFVERNYKSSNGPQKQTIVLTILPNEFIYSFKDSQMGGFEVIGKEIFDPSPELTKACL
jgi:hypothetical protein